MRAEAGRIAHWSINPARTMLTRPATTETDLALAQIRQLIAGGDYGPGDRLPPERALIERLGVSRATLRKALDALERQGAIWRHVGKGTFVSDGDVDGHDGVAQLARRTTPVKMMRARLCLEPVLAREAAMNASTEALARLKSAMSLAHSARSWHDYETQDDAFHRAVAEAGDNLPLLALFDQLNGIRRAVAWGNVERHSARPSADHPSFAEHAAIAAAIAARSPDAAADAMRGHLKSVAMRLFGD
jgi:DNA-binding FadR family transcriptional regulator